MPRDRNVVDAVLRACRRAAMLMGVELERGVGSLATIASVAPLLGLYGTIEAIYGSFQGCGCEQSWMRRMLAYHLGNALVPMAMGLAVGACARWFYNYLSSRARVFEIEMENASVVLVNHVAVLLARQSQQCGHP